MSRRRTALFISWFVMTLSLASCGGGSSSDETSFAGTFQNEALKLVLEADGERFRGTVTMGGGLQLPVTAKKSAAGLEGSFESEGRAFAFTTSWSGDRLAFETDGTKYLLSPKVVANPLAKPASNPVAKSEAANPLASGGASGAAAPVADPLGDRAAASSPPSPAKPLGTGTPPPGGERVDAATAERLRREQEQGTQALANLPPLTQEYRHQIGFFFRYPEGWKATENEAGILLSPPDPHVVDGQPAEVYLVMGDSAEGITRADDPQVDAYLEQNIVTGGFPFLRKEGSAKTARFGAHDGAVYSWSGKSPSGLDVRARVWITLVKGYAIGVFGIASKDRFDARVRAIEEIVATFGFTKPQTDPRLVGQWMHENVYSSGDFSAVTVRYLALREDGSCVESGRMMAGMQHTDSGGNYTGDTSVDTGDSDATHGRWSAAAGKILLQWSGGREDWQYIVSGDDMLWTSGNSKKLWQRTR